MVYCIIVIAILLWIITFVNCYEVCGVLKDGKLQCCTNFKYEDGKCIECPKGWSGEECNRPCPNGFYGVFCKETCNCIDGQICDAQDGCIQNKIVDSLTIMESTSTEQQSTNSNGYHEGILWNHLYGVTLGVVIVFVILLVLIHRKWKTIEQESESRNDQQTEEARSQAVELNKNTEESVYEEICEFDTGCSHTHTFSIDSRGKEVNQVQQMKHTILHLDAIAR